MAISTVDAYSSKIIYLLDIYIIYRPLSTKAEDTRNQTLHYLNSFIVLIHAIYKAWSVCITQTVTFQQHSIWNNRIKLYYHTTTYTCFKYINYFSISSCRNQEETKLCSKYLHPERGRAWSAEVLCLPPWHFSLSLLPEHSQTMIDALPTNTPYILILKPFLANM